MLQVTIIKVICSCVWLSWDIISIIVIYMYAVNVTAGIKSLQDVNRNSYQNGRQRFKSVSVDIDALYHWK